MKNFILLVLLIVFCSCSGQTKTNLEQGLAKNIIPIPVHDSGTKTDGIVFFSNDNGLTWEDKSRGLPSSIGIGLGGIDVSDGILALAGKENGVYIFDFQKEVWVNIPTNKLILKNNIGALLLFKGGIYVGTQFAGVFVSFDSGNSWTNINFGLLNLTIRKLVQINDKLYAGTNAGIFSYNELLKKWDLEFGNEKLQVNGISEQEGIIYIGTNQGAFSAPIGKKEWKKILAGRSLHNISSDDKTIFAMVYNELFSSVDKGRSWQSIQNGLPDKLYTFNVIRNGNSLFAAQWDGVYRKEPNEIWKLYSNGLPHNLAIINMKLYNGIIIISGNGRKLKNRMNTNKQVNSLPLRIE